MDEHGLPIVGAGVDYTKVPALDHKNTLVFLNKFIVHTTQFLNRFSSVSEERLTELSLRIQRLNISLNILEAKLSSIPDLEGVQAGTQYEPPAAVAAAGTSTASGASGTTSGQGAASGVPPPPPQPNAAATTTATPAAATEGEPIPPPQPAQESQSGRRKAKDDPRYQKYFKMKRLGVNPLQLEMNMKRDGLNPDLLQNEDSELPPEEQGPGVPDASYNAHKSNDSSSESSDESDASFESD